MYGGRCAAWALALVAWVALGSAQATERKVPSQYSTIQAAIDAAADGDEVVVADGVYTGIGNKDLDLRGEAITVRSASGDPAACIIDCEADGRGFYFHSSETSTSVVDGLTIQNGNSDGGGGVYCNSSSPTLTNCTIKGNTVNAQFAFGGGVYCYSDSNPTLTNCTITGNTSSGTYAAGGGLFCRNSGPTLTNCAITRNLATGEDTQGGGVYADFSVPSLTNCTIAYNAANGGGGVFCWWCSPVLIDCLITANWTGGTGGGLYCYYSSPTLTRCTITENWTFYYVGGLYCYGSSPVLTNCIIAQNTAYGESGCGGGVVCDHNSYPTLTNCTIRENWADYHGGAVYCTYSSNPGLTNCILWGNTPEEIYVDSGSYPVVTYCDVQGGWTGTGNIDADPSLAFPNDLHLLPDSPCIDAGTNDPSGGLAPSDLDGTPRPLDGDDNGTLVADIGAYEFNPATPTLALSATSLEAYVREGHSGTQTLGIRNSSLGVLAWELHWEAGWLAADPTSGTSAGETDEVTLTLATSGLLPGTHTTSVWVDAPSAFNAPRAVKVILHVNTARLVPNQYATIQAAIDAAESGDDVVIADGVYSGPGNHVLDTAGKCITVCSASGDPNTCTIDCQGGDWGFDFHTHVRSDAVVRGLTIRNARYGGVNCDYSSPTLVDCTFTGNVGSSTGVHFNYYSRPQLIHCTITDNTGSGGGVFCIANSSPTLTNCTITRNGGGGVYCDTSCNPVLIDCLITDNAGAHGGGVWCVYWSSPTFVNCLITGNTGGYGGGVYCWYNCSPTLTNCIITDNAGGHGGGVYCEAYSGPTLTNCTITDNTGGNGAGVYCQSTSSPAVINCILWGDTPAEIHVESGSPVVSYCDVQGGWIGTGNIDADPLFVNAGSGDFRLQAGSLCIDAGDPSFVPTPGETDLDGHLCVWDGNGDGTAIVDMGAYEFGSFAYGDVNCDGAVNNFDITPFVMGLRDPDGYETAYPECESLLADINGDGLVNNFDITPFVHLLAGG